MNSVWVVTEEPHEYESVRQPFAVFATEAEATAFVDGVDAWQDGAPKRPRVQVEDIVTNAGRMREWHRELTAYSKANPPPRPLVGLTYTYEAHETAVQGTLYALLTSRP